MPTGDLDKAGAALHKKVYDDELAKCKGKGGDEKSCAESAAKQAWGAVKHAGWKQDANGSWHKSDVAIQEFSLRIDKASHDKATGENRWSAIASDTDTDLYGDSMSMELFSKFMDKIETNTKVPEDYRSDFWDGGMPYISVSHYMDLNGKGVPGEIDKIYVDGNRLKAKGKYFDTPLGNACYKAIESDLYSDAGKARQDKVRVSIAFLDYRHKHKSNGYEYDRLTAKSICPECLAELMTGESEGKIFLDGQLIHLAHTRVPVNERTIMEVDKSMPKTRKEDAASIVGEELADMLEDENKIVGKSDAIIIKSDEDEAVEETEPVDEGSEPVVEAVDEAPDQPEEEIETEEVAEPVMESVVSVATSRAELRSLIQEVIGEVNTPIAHPLDSAIAELKAKYDEVYKTDMTENDKLVAIQEPFNALGEFIKGSMKPVAETVDTPSTSEINANGLVEALSLALKPLTEKLDTLNMQLSQQSLASHVQPVKPVDVPQQRSLTAPVKPILPFANSDSSGVAKSQTPHLRAIIEGNT